MKSSMNSDIAMLRHTLSTLAYRAAKPLRDVPDSFAAFRVDEKSKPPIAILAHMGDLMVWALSMAQGDGVFGAAHDVSVVMESAS
jgi:hypothetical protein